MPNARVGPNPNPNTYDGCMVNNNRGRGVGGGGGGKHGITMQVGNKALQGFAR